MLLNRLARRYLSGSNPPGRLVDLSQATTKSPVLSMATDGWRHRRGCEFDDELGADRCPARCRSGRGCRDRAWHRRRSVQTITDMPLDELAVSDSNWASVVLVLTRDSALSDRSWRPSRGSRPGRCRRGARPALGVPRGGITRLLEDAVHGCVLLVKVRPRSRLQRERPGGSGERTFAVPRTSAIPTTEAFAIAPVGKACRRGDGRTCRYVRFKRPDKKNSWRPRDALRQAGLDPTESPAASPVRTRRDGSTTSGPPRPDDPASGVRGSTHGASARREVRPIGGLVGFDAGPEVGERQLTSGPGNIYPWEAPWTERVNCVFRPPTTHEIRGGDDHMNK